MTLPKSTHRKEQVRIERRGTAAERGYGHKWQQARMGYLRKHPLCVCCSANGIVAAAELVDHVLPHRGDMAVFWKSDDWQALCNLCHETIKKPIEIRWLQGLVRDVEMRLDRAMPEHFG